MYCIKIITTLQDEEAELLFTVDESVQLADKQSPDKGGGGDANITKQESGATAGTYKKSFGFRVFMFFRVFSKKI